MKFIAENTESSLAVSSKVALTLTTASGAGSAYAGFTVNDIGIIVGAIGVVLGLAMQWYFGQEKLKLIRQRLQQIDTIDKVAINESTLR